MDFQNDLPLSYCMNVHGGMGFEDLIFNLKSYAASVREKCCDKEEVMGVGLWLSDEVLAEVVSDWDKVDELKVLLKELKLVAYTFNGFPFGNFHDEVVKHEVYRPRWDEEARLTYTKNLARLLAGLLEEGDVGSISTLPLGWRGEVGKVELEGCVKNLLAMANFLTVLEAETGRYIYLTIEPEPGCYLDRARDVVGLFEKELFVKGEKAVVQRYLQVCHDVCHAGVMYEEQHEVWGLYEKAGISVGKVQLSSAVKVLLKGVNLGGRKLVIDELKAFAEDRYLHQCGVMGDGGSFVLYEDLPAVLCDEKIWGEADELRVHFHVPLFIEVFGLLGTTQNELKACLEVIKQKRLAGWFGHLEVETYAWGVLPLELQEDDLATGIAKEMRWVKDFLC